MKIINNETPDATRVQSYLSHIRSNSAYTTFRVVVNVIQWLLFIAGGLTIATGVMAKDNGTPFMLMVGILLIVCAKVGKQSVVMLADIADATIDAASKK